MRPALALALSLLLLVLLLNASLELGRGEHSPTASAVHVVAAAKGRMLAPASNTAGLPLAGVIQVGDTNLTLEASRPGLRVATLSGSLSIVDHVDYDVAHSSEDVDAFVSHCRDAPPWTVLVIASTGSFRPGNADDLRRLQASIDSLGSELRPLDAMPSSWALLCLRCPDGWVKLAEGYSRESGVAVAFTIDSDLSRYEDFQGESMWASTGLRRTQLGLELDEVSNRQNTTVQSRMTLGGETRDAIYAPVGLKPGRQFSRVVWEGVPLGDDPVFRCAIGMLDGAWKESNGVVYSILVNDQLVAERPLGVAGTLHGPGWMPWEVDLGAFGGLDVRFELHVSALGDLSRGWALWGEPTIESRIDPGPR
jgi:hypothetical protein